MLKTAKSDDGTKQEARTHTSSMGHGARMRPGLIHLAPFTGGQLGVAVEDGVQDAVRTRSGKVKAKHQGGWTPLPAHGEGISTHRFWCSSMCSFWG